MSNRNRYIDWMLQRTRRREEILRELDQQIHRQGAVRFSRGAYGDSTVFGFPLRVEQQLVLVRELQGLQPEGFVILQLGDIDGLETSRSDRYTEEVVRCANFGEEAEAPAVDLSSWRAVCDSLRGTRQVVEVVDEREGWMDVGRIVRAGEAMMSMQCLDAVGCWETHPTNIPYANITRMHLPDRYGGPLN